MITSSEGKLEDLRCINEWHKVIEEDEMGPLDVERGQEELSNAWPRGFLLIVKKNSVGSSFSWLGKPTRLKLTNAWKDIWLHWQHVPGG
jgi:hypothetical protein